MTWRAYGSGSDMSGGLPIRLAYTANGNLWRQMGTSATAWGSWKKFAIGTGTTAQYIRGDASLATFPTIPPDPTGVYLPLAGGTMTGSIAMSNNNITGIGNLTLNNGFRLKQGASNYASINSWVYLEGVHGLYTGTNGAHFYPNTGSDYGAWRMSGSRNGWGGITFLGGENTLMASTSTMGFYNDANNEWMIECQRNSYTRLYYNGTEQARTDNGFFFANNQIRSPIFYDSDNTAYYLNPADTSTSLSTAGKWICQGGHGSARLQLNYQHSATDSANSGTLTGWVSEPGITYNGAGIGGNVNVSGQYYGRQYNSGYGVYVRFDKSGGTLSHWTTTGNAGTAGGQGTQQWYNDASGNSFSTTSCRAPVFYDSNDTTYYVNAATGSNLHTPITFQTNDSTLTFRDAGTNAFQMVMSAGDELYLGSNNNYQLQMTTSGNVNTQGQWRFGANFVKVGNSSTYNSDDGSWGSRFVVASTVHARIDCAQDANAVRASWFTHTGQLYSTFGTVTGHDMRLISHNATRQTLHNGYSVEQGSYRAPIFYDNNNTGYYGDFAGTSQLNVLNCAGTLTVTGSSGVVAPKFTDYNNGAFYLDPANTTTSLNVAGDVVAYASSDIKLKNNVTPITNALDKLSKIGGYTFEWNEISHKETGKKDIGVVAQEVEEILPEIVQTRSNGYKAVDYQKLTALLIESVKEQQFIIDDLKSRIERLEKI